MSTGFIIFAHGSRLAGANEAVCAAAARFARSGHYDLVEVAYLDCTPPGLVTAVGRLVESGARRVIVIPYFLTLGRHTAEDLPRIAAEASRAHQNVRIEITPPLDGHPGLAEVLLARAREALAPSGEERMAVPSPPHDLQSKK